MDDLTKEASRLSEVLLGYSDMFGISLDALERAGFNGLDEINVQCVPRKDSVFATSLSKQVDFVPVDVIRSMCLAAASIHVFLSMNKKGLPNSGYFLIRAAEELGLVVGMALGVMHEDTRSASFAAFMRHAKDPKQADRSIVKECWKTWQMNPDDYKGKAEFARDMLQQFPNLKNQSVIERWCRGWELGKK